MRVLFYCKSIGAARLAHALAQMMVERGVATEFGAVVYRDSGEGHYLRTQASDLFSQIVSESEMHRAASAAAKPDPALLAEIDEKYGIPTIWQYVTQNRWLIMQRQGYLWEYGSQYSRDELLAHVLVPFQTLKAFIESFQPDIVVYPDRDTGPSSALVLFRVADAHGIPVIVPVNTRIGSYMTFTNTLFSRVPLLEQRYQEIHAGAPSPNREKARRILADFREGGSRYVMRGTKPAPNGSAESTPNGTSHSLRFLGERATGTLRKHQANDPLYVSWFSRQYANLVMRRRRMELARFEYARPVPGGNYVFFPLHVEPELTLLLYAPFYTNQQAIIQNIAQSLPFDTSLYVKEHPKGVGRRPLHFYRTLAGMPNVRVISPEVRSHELIQNAQGVVTISGSVGLEAMLIGKPAITFGDVWYNFMDKLVWHTHSFEELPHLIKRFSSFRSDENSVLDFLTALLDISISVDERRIANALVHAPIANARNSQDFNSYAELLLQRMTAPAYPIPLTE